MTAFQKCIWKILFYHVPKKVSLFELVVVGNNLHKHVGIKYHHKRYKQRRATGDTIQKCFSIVISQENRGLC